MRTMIRTLISSVVGTVAFAALLFLPAGTLAYWQGWAFLAVFATISLVPTLYLSRIDPAAMQRRMRAGPRAETRPIQRVVMVGTFIAFPAMLVLAALDYRFGWSGVPAWLSVVGDVLVAVGLGLAMFVVYQNRYAAATITVEEGQPLVTTGVYGVVRHPMYTGNVILMIGMALALGSYWALLIAAAGVALMVVRIFDEEKMLSGQLDGYRQYQETVGYRLVPRVW
ncbi:hypothetical protein B1R94_06990 [Mycolicibacterium litorale]|nr:hypothetical protein B1R94_06990 [Mycolicibacterium litorale]